MINRENRTANKSGIGNFCFCRRRFLVVVGEHQNSPARYVLGCDAGNCAVSIGVSAFSEVEPNGGNLRGRICNFYGSFDVDNLEALASAGLGFSTDRLDWAEAA